MGVVSITYGNHLFEISIMRTGPIQVMVTNPMYAVISIYGNSPYEIMVTVTIYYGYHYPVTNET